MSQQASSNTNGYQYYYFIDILRCYAVLSVVFSHYPIIKSNAFLKYIYECLPGVPLFFTISGFLITKILLNQKGKQSTFKLFKSFYMRRVLRIFPVYYLTIIALLITNFHPYIKQLPYDLLYITNFKIAYDGGYHNTFAPHFWSLAVEEQFYLFWPFVVFIGSLVTIKRFALGILILGFSSIAFSYIIKDYYFIVDRTTGPLSYLGLGCVLAYYFTKSNLPQYFTQHKTKIALACLSLFLFNFFALEANVDFSLIFSHLLFAVLILFSATSKGHPPIVIKPLLFIGKISYGIYVYHMFIPGIMHHFKLKYDTFLGLNTFHIASLGYTILVACLSWFILERFFLKLKERF